MAESARINFDGARYLLGRLQEQKLELEAERDELRSIYHQYLVPATHLSGRDEGETLVSDLTAALDTLQDYIDTVQSWLNSLQPNQPDSHPDLPPNVPRTGITKVFYQNDGTRYVFYGNSRVAIVDSGGFVTWIDNSKGSVSVQSDLKDVIPNRTKKTGIPGSKPAGKSTPIPQGSNSINQRAVELENSSAIFLASAGFRVLQNPPPKDNNKHPDYLLEGNYADCIAPITNDLKTVLDRIDQKVYNNQASRIILNLTDCDIPQEVIATILNGPPPYNRKLEEVIAIKDDAYFWLHPLK